MKNKKKLLIAIFINLIVFGIINIIFNIKYEQVDDFIIYNLYSGLDGTYNIHGVYMHPVICFILSLFFRVAPIINWHSIFLLSIQFICFTSIGYIILKKHNNGMAIILYVVCDSIFYSTLLMLIQYTSVAALAILTSFILLINMIEEKENRNIKYKLFIFILFTIGVMIRTQALLIVAPFMGVYFLVYLLRYIKNRNEKDEIKMLIKYYLIIFFISLVIYISNLVIYNANPVYKEYMEYNNIRTMLHDISQVDYEENKEIFDEIGWSKNDHYMFYTFNFGDENIYSKENLEKILNYKIQKDGKYNINTDLETLKDSLISEQTESIPTIFVIFVVVFIISLLNKNIKTLNLLVFFTTIGIHLIFIAMGRSVFRVIIPEYILGTFLILSNLEFKNEKSIDDGIKNSIITVLIIIILSSTSGALYKFNYKLGDYQSTKDIIEYTNNNRQNVYLYTVPSLQFRYLAYNVYQMPPLHAFSNLRVMGGWDMYTQNYIDFKNRYNLQGTLLDLLNENVYLIDGKVVWSGREYDNYKQNVLYAIKEHYNIDVECKEIKQFDNLKIYKLYVANEAK